jgi:hypothetical protein
MVRALLLIFGYRDLEGMISDLVTSYRYVTGVLGASTRDILIITDIFHDGLGSYEEMIEIQQLECYHRFQDLATTLSLISHWMRHASKGDRALTDDVFIHISGHGRLRSLLLPNNELLTRDLLRLIVDGWSSSSRLLLLIDTCHASSLLSLPFTARGYRSEADLVTPQVILMTSCDEGQRANASQVGSLFTNAVLRYLSNGSSSRRVDVVRSEIKWVERGSHDTNPAISSSLPVTRLWSWLFGVRETTLLIEAGTIYCSVFYPYRSVAVT